MLDTHQPRLLPATVLHRVRQGIAALRPGVPADRDAILASTLSDPQAEAFRGLPLHDQAHLCRVYRTLRRAGVDGRDLLAAALLHDLGKVDPSDRVRVRLVDRVARVLLARLAPNHLHRLASLPAPGWRLGLALAVHHPTVGAERAAGLGCSARTCWLIAHHHDRNPPPDPDLQCLMAADRLAH